jgi:glycosidase
MIVEAFAFWVRRYDIDGFRVDAAWGPRERAPDFWPAWRAALKRIKPDLLLLAEASAREPYYFRNGFDVAYDWSDKLGEWAWRGAFDDRRHVARRLRAVLADPGPSEPRRLALRFLDNYDTGARFITRYGLGRTRVAAALMMTLPGVPALYTGQEVGAVFEPYDEGPPIAWDDPHGLRPWYARLIALRAAEPALRGRALRLLDLAPADTVLGFIRPAPRASDSRLVLLNFDSAPATVAVPRAALDAIAARRAVVDLLDGERLALDAARPRIALPAYGVRVLRGE